MPQITYHTARALERVAEKIDSEGRPVGGELALEIDRPLMSELIRVLKSCVIDMEEALGADPDPCDNRRRRAIQE
jgi:hypothetical protein